MERQTHQWTISLPPLLSRQAMKLARDESRTKSELVREALRAYIARRERFEELRAALSRNLAKRGIRGLRDIERMIDEGRV